MRIRVFMPPEDYDRLREKVLESADMVELDQMKEHESTPLPFHLTYTPPRQLTGVL
jgi:hypothetical protein